MSAQHQEQPGGVPTNLTPQQYLERERKAEYRSEFIGDKLYPMEWEAAARHMGLDPRAMAGAQRGHNRITASLTRLLGNVLLGSPCEPFAGDMRVKTNLAGNYAYPDVVVACEPHFEDEGFDTLTNPLVIVAVLSPATQERDRAEKWALYQQLPTLRDYLLVTTAAPRVEHHTRQDAGTWLYRSVEGLEASLALASIGCTLALRDIYERITFVASDTSNEN